MGAKITAELVKQLRERTSVGMGKCKQALEKADGDLEKAIDILRKEGMASAVKKEGRATKEGAIVFKVSDGEVAIVEINSETDFVAQNDIFKEFAAEVIDAALSAKPASVEAFLTAKGSSGQTIDELRAGIVQRLGENIQIKRVKVMPKKEGHSYGIYSHMGGKIVTIVELKGASDEEALARDIAMHVAAESPEYLSHDEVPAETKTKEEEIAKGQVPGNKPAEIVEKIVSGKVRSALDQICLVCQKFVKDPSQTVSKYVESEGKARGKTLVIVGFDRWVMGG